ncbi:PREDICTED: uncharacterized protein LOC105554038 [Mandrillus leucophaeus]|uniref:uncharacterized protein LOC105554038 n=1 Tax=Mandrillus leucophaeus TaxID=9568 RepID=UPI0005F586DB|nr:PREDICTED: uncharacterized protein LOC105554038 [Mandrillus leucophaeus]
MQLLRYGRELSVGDLPGCGCSCSLQSRSYQNKLDKDGPKTMELLAPKQARHYGKFECIMPLDRQPKSYLIDHRSWSAYQVKASKERRNITWSAAPPKTKSATDGRNIDRPRVSLHYDEGRNNPMHSLILESPREERESAKVETMEMRF